MSAARNDYSRLRVSGLLLALLAWASLIGGALAMPEVDALGPLASIGVICHARTGAAEDAPTKPAPSHRDCALCPLCVAAASPAAILLAPVTVPRPVAVASWRPASARAPPPAPARRHREAQPRGPPLSV